jgi:hypothetical protein
LNGDVISNESSTYIDLGCILLLGDESIIGC